MTNVKKNVFDVISNPSDDGKFNKVYSVESNMTENAETGTFPHTVNATTVKLL